MGVRADWHVDALDLDQGDDPMQEIAALTAGATVIDLTKTEAELESEFAELLTKEGHYAARSKGDDGVSPLECSLKWSDDHKIQNPNGSLSCFTCPHYCGIRESAHSLICALGREQEDVLAQLRGLRLADSLDDELAVAYESEIEACAELAAHLANGDATPVLVA